MKNATQMAKEKAIIEAFVEAVYPGNYQLVMATFNEMAVLKDATDEIIQLRETAARYLKKNIELCANLQPNPTTR
jgi:hypothetical protein